MKNINLLKSFLFSLPVISFLIYFFYWPLSYIILLAFDHTIYEWVELLNNRLFIRFVVFTFTQAFLTVIGSIIIGVPSGYLLARTNPFGIKFLRAAITVPFLFPPLVILLGFVVLFEPYGILSDISGSFWKFSPFSFWGIILAHIMYNISVVSRISEAAFNDESADHHNLAKTLGASFGYRIRTITLPHIRPSLDSAILLVFLYSFNSFAIVLILGEVKFQTLEVMIYSRSQGIRYNHGEAAIIAVIQLVINSIIILLYTQRRSYRSIEATTNPIKRNNRRSAPTIFLYIVILFTWSPIIIVIRNTIKVYFSSSANLKNQVISGKYNQYLGTSSIRVLENTLLFGIIVSMVTVILSTLIIVSSQSEKNSSKLENFFLFFTLIPMGTSAITLSFAILLTHGTNSLFSKYVWIYIISAQIIAALPFASRAMFSSWQRVSEDLILVSTTLGASSWQTFRKVILPIMKPSILVAILFSFAISIGEFGATYYLVRGEWVTISVAIYKLFASRTTLLPNIFACFLAFTALISFWLIEKLGGGLEMKL